MFEPRSAPCSSHAVHAVRAVHAATPPNSKNSRRSFRGVKIRPSKHITQKVRRRLPVRIHNGIVSTSPTGPLELCPTSLASLALSKRLSCRRSIPVAKRRRAVHKTQSVMHSGGGGEVLESSSVRFSMRGMRSSPSTSLHGL